MTGLEDRPLRLILFDVDGTLVDSQASIVGAMTAAFEDTGLPVPERSKILSVVGLSLEIAMPQLAPDAPSHDDLIQIYKQTYYFNSCWPHVSYLGLYRSLR